MRRRGWHVPITLGILGAACSPRTPAKFDASYDAHLGYPAEVRIDHVANAADDELALQIPELHITTGP